MRIGELAQRAGTTTRALRFYEAQGLLAARRAGNGYRDYDEQDLRLVSEIMQLRGMGLTLEETRPFVECLRAGHEQADACEDSIEAYQRKLAEVDGMIQRLTEVRASLYDKLATALDRRPLPCTVPAAHDAAPEEA
jgi:DNA-binding transcriptional MerR regulator